VREIADGVIAVEMLIANAYLAKSGDSWVVVDTGVPGRGGKIAAAAQQYFGTDARPRAIVLTHGHFDHAGSAQWLALLWKVPVFAPKLELPFLAGGQPYPPLDHTPPGFFSALSRVFPSRTVNLAGLVQQFEELEGWETIETPGHTPGHVSFFRRSDGVLLAGDAVTTMDLDSAAGTLFKRPRVCRPPVPATTNWELARTSVQRLAELRPLIIAAGHGPPMQDAADELSRLAAGFPIPLRGRYVRQPVRAGETGAP
jgi:glyoxylase-like metal-dependent hydrolase (beta-lactamase superfamily II)